jgi:uncharacterized protein YhjY with autotransporter beta-barrel domain
LGTLQTTKTVSQFSMARSRADSRLDVRGKRAALGEPLMLAQLEVGRPSAASDTPGALREGTEGSGVFADVEYDRRRRATTQLEAGYRGGITEAIVGWDHTTRDQLVAGAFVGWRSASADYRNPSLVPEGPNSQFKASLDAATQAAICRIGPGGGFDDEGPRIGAFVVKHFGSAFADAAVQFSRRSYRYSRNVCTIESSSSALVPDPDSLSGFSSSNTPVDDVFAGTISAKARLTEWAASARAGIDFGAESGLQWGPRLLLNYTRTQLGGFTETGRTSVTHQVKSASGLVVLNRSAGDPIGLEMSFDRQRRTSVQSELQLVAAYRFETGFGTLVPRAAVAWQHEFKGERQLVNVRMAQDFRPSPTAFSYTTDSLDKNKGTVAIGASLLHGERFAGGVELRHLVADDRFDSTSLVVQLRWRY